MLQEGVAGQWLSGATIAAQPCCSNRGFPALAPAGVDAELVFTDGAPWLGRPVGGFTLGEDRIATGRAQLIVGDVVTWPGHTLEVST